MCFSYLAFCYLGYSFLTQMSWVAQKLREGEPQECHQRRDGWCHNHLLAKSKTSTDASWTLFTTLEQTLHSPTPPLWVDMLHLSVEGTFTPNFWWIWVSKQPCLVLPAGLKHITTLKIFSKCSTMWTEKWQNCKEFHGWRHSLVAETNISTLTYRLVHINKSRKANFFYPRVN